MNIDHYRLNLVTDTKLAKNKDFIHNNINPIIFISIIRLARWTDSERH